MTVWAVRFTVSLYASYICEGNNCITIILAAQKRYADTVRFKVIRKERQISVISCV